MTNQSKIARLPHEVREELNRRLQDGQSGTDTLKWLNALPQVQMVLKADYAGEPVSKQNLSRWKHGGYQHWRAEQLALAEVGQMMTQAGEFGKQAEGSVTDRLAMWLAMRCAMAAAKLAREGSGASGEDFRQLCRNVVALRRGDHYARWIEIERERMEAEKKPDPKKMEKQFKEWAMDPEIKREFFPEQLTEEEKEQAWKEIFGLTGGRKNPYEKETDQQ